MTGEIRGNDLVGKTIVSEEKGKTFGEVDDVSFVSETGELMNLLISDATDNLRELNVEANAQGRHMVPFSAVRSVGDFVIVSQDDIV
ncbi:MAG: PRC-barrel domain-containing protein [Candidatus Nanohaloarchaea archaeon]|nr:PRC-barrel domain-containing protein [Candidatus Nanohaloarchaea archaeon]